MKLFFVSLLGLFVSASTSVSVADVFDDLDQCKISCSQQCIELDAQLETALRDYKRSCGGTRPRPNPNPPRGSVEIYNSDSCSSSLIAVVSSSTRCSGLESTGTRAWGIKMNGTCHNISDMSVSAACFAFSAGASSEAVEIFRSDSCSGSLVAIVDSQSDCSGLPSRGSDAWAVKIGGQCQNISDISVQAACTQYSSANARNAVKIFRSDSCSGSLIATVNRNTDCSQFSASGSDAWGVEINGQCQNISDTSVRSACENFKGAGFKK